MDYTNVIVTRYFGGRTVNPLGLRIKARGKFGAKLTVPLDPALTIEAGHVAAAKALADKFDYHGIWVGGLIPFLPRVGVFVLVTPNPNNHEIRSFASFVCEGKSRALRFQDQQSCGLVSDHWSSRPIEPPRWYMRHIEKPGARSI